MNYFRNAVCSKITRPAASSKRLAYLGSKMLAMERRGAIIEPWQTEMPATNPYRLTCRYQNSWKRSLEVYNKCLALNTIKA